MNPRRKHHQIISAILTHTGRRITPSSPRRPHIPVAPNVPDGLVTQLELAGHERWMNDVVFHHRATLLMQGLTLLAHDDQEPLDVRTIAIRCMTLMPMVDAQLPEDGPVMIPDPGGVIGSRRTSW